jgi:hypothetical protein
MSDITVSERRLSAALDRIDQLLERGPKSADSRPAEQGELEKDLAVARAENARLAYELAALRSAGDVPPDATLSDLRIRLDRLGEQTVRLAAANDQLASANGDLVAASAGQSTIDPAILAAKDAEISALKSARAAEAAQMEEVLAELERLLAGDGADALPHAGQEAVLEAAGDEAGLPETGSTPQGFSGVYADDPEDTQTDRGMESEGR